MKQNGKKKNPSIEQFQEMFSFLQCHEYLQSLNSIQQHLDIKALKTFIWFDVILTRCHFIKWCKISSKSFTRASEQLMAVVSLSVDVASLCRSPSFSFNTRLLFCHMLVVHCFAWLTAACVFSLTPSRAEELSVLQGKPLTYVYVVVVVSPFDHPVTSGCLSLIVYFIQ